MGQRATTRRRGSAVCIAAPGTRPKLGEAQRVARCDLSSAQRRAQRRGRTGALGRGELGQEPRLLAIEPDRDDKLDGTAFANLGTRERHLIPVQLCESAAGTTRTSCWWLMAASVTSARPYALPCRVRSTAGRASRITPIGRPAPRSRCRTSPPDDRGGAVTMAARDKHARAFSRRRCRALGLPSGCHRAYIVRRARPPPAQPGALPADPWR